MSLHQTAVREWIVVSHALDDSKIGNQTFNEESSHSRDTLCSLISISVDIDWRNIQ